MVERSRNNVVSIKDWIARSAVEEGAMRPGWDVTPNMLIDVHRPATFYICEPLQTGFTAFSVFDRSYFESIAKGGTEMFGSAREIFEAAAAITIDVIDEMHGPKSEEMDAALNGNLINFAGTLTARQILDDDSYRHFGCIVYRNPLRKDGVIISFRPTATSSTQTILSKDEIVLTVARYILHDFSKHPNFFEGINVMQRLELFSQKLGVDLRSLLDE